MEKDKAEKILKATLYILCFWDLLLGLVMIVRPQPAAVFFGQSAETGLFFIRATGVNQLLAFYIQYIAARRGGADASALRFSIVFRFLFPPLYLCHILFPDRAASSFLIVSLLTFSVLDYLLTALLCYLSKSIFGKMFP